MSESNKKTKVFLCGVRTGTDVEEMRKTIDNFSYSIVGWIVGKRFFNSLKTHFPESIIYDKTMSSNKKNFDIIVDSKIIEVINKYLVEIFYILDRNQFERNKTSFMKMLVVYRHIQYAISIIKETNPDLIIFNNTPHDLTTFSLYVVSIAYRKQFRIINRENFGVGHIYNCRERIEITTLKPDGLISIENNEPDNFEKGKAIYNQLEIKSSNSYQNSMPSYMKKQFSSKWYHSFKILTSKNDDMLRKVYKFYRSIYLGLKQRALLKQYERIANTNIDLNANYVLLALHYQPEKTTIPDGSIYAQQWLIANQISQSLPNGWKLLIKEHPSTFMLKDTIEGFRDKKYYEKFDFSNAEFVPLGIDHYDLINNAKCVATITGTIGVEAIFRRIPVLVFGNASYVGCEGVFKIENSNNIRSIFEEIENSVYSVDKSLIYEYFIGLSNNSELYIANEKKELDPTEDWCYRLEIVEKIATVLDD